MVAVSAPAGPPYDGGVVDREDALLQLGRQLRQVATLGESLGRRYAQRHGLHANDFRALQLVLLAQNQGSPLTASELAAELSLSPAAVTYLVERLVGSGHLRRVPDARDRRRVRLEYADHGWSVAQDFFRPMGEHHRDALADFDDAELATASRVLAAALASLISYQDELDEDAIAPAEPDPVETPQGASGQRVDP